MGQNKLNVLYVFGFDYSLKLWNDSGALEREFSYFETIAKEQNVKFTLITYGDINDHKYLNSKFISIIPIFSIYKRPNLKFVIFIKSIAFTFKIYKNLRHVDLIKQNQLTGVWVSWFFKFLLKKPLYTRTGYDEYTFSKNSNKNFMKKAFFKLLTQLSLNYSNLYSVSNKTDFLFITNNYFFNKSKLIYRPNWVFTGIQKKPISQKNKNHILSVGRLEKQKNYLFLLSLLKGTNYCLDIIGDGSEKENLLTYAKKNKIKLRILPKTNNLELLRHLNDYEFFVLPSLYEGNPKVLLEAMAAGLVVFASNIPNHSEIIEDSKNGFLFSLNNNEFLDKFERIQSDIKITKNVSNEAINYINSKHSLEHAIKNEIKDYKFLIQNL